MYEDIVKRLRRCNQFKCRECEYEPVESCRFKLNSEAADAIEKLQEENKELLFRCGQAEALIEYYQNQEGE